MQATLTLLATDAQSVYYGPAMGTLDPDEVPTALFLPRDEYVALGEPERVTVTVEAADEPEPGPEPDEPDESDPEPESDPDPEPES